MESLEHLLNLLQKSPGWEQQQYYEEVLRCWSEVVGPKGIPVTRPVYIKRGVLWVATASSVWAQTLSLQRYTLVQKLNSLLSQPLIDLRFFTSTWKAATSYEDSITSTHPSSVESIPISAIPEGTSVFDSWLAQIKEKGRSLPLCPECQSSTPPGELDRWSVCALCMGKKWS